MSTLGCAMELREGRLHRNAVCSGQCACGATHRNAGSSARQRPHETVAPSSGLDQVHLTALVWRWSVFGDQGRSGPSRQRGQKQATTRGNALMLDGAAHLDDECPMRRFASRS